MSNAPPCENVRDIHVGGKGIQSFVEIIHLNKNTTSHDNAKHIRARMRQLVIAADCEFDGNAKAFDRHDRHGANKGAYGNVYKRVGTTVFRDNRIDHDEGEYEDREAVQHKACHC